MLLHYQPVKQIRVVIPKHSDGQTFHFPQVFDSQLSQIIKCTMLLQLSVNTCDLKVLVSIVQ